MQDFLNSPVYHVARLSVIYGRYAPLSHSKTKTCRPSTPRGRHLRGRTPDAVGPGRQVKDSESALPPHQPPRPATEHCKPLTLAAAAPGKSCAHKIQKTRNRGITAKEVLKQPKNSRAVLAWCGCIKSTCFGAETSSCTVDGKLPGEGRHSCPCSR